MKKIILTISVVFLTFCVYAQTGQIRELSGTVELKSSGQAAFVPAKAGDRVSQETVISTGFKSTALVEIGSSVITVRPLTRLTLMEITSSSGAETLNVNLQTGRVRVDVTPPSGTRAAMSVSSAVATASVRGTSFDFDTRNIRVNTGEVSFAGTRGMPMRVSAGSDSRVQSDGRAADPIEVKASELRPPAPGGPESSGLTGGGTSSSEPASPSSGSFTVNLEY